MKIDLEKAKPMLMNTAMVKAILEDRKTVTRRVAKARINNESCDVSHCTSTEFSTNIGGDCVNFYGKFGFYVGAAKPKYKAGDIVYVRETWGNWNYDDPECNATYYLYRADYPDGAKGYWYEPEHINFCDFPKWHPSIHMPKEAARLFLRITDVRVEKLKDITEEQAIAEGFKSREEFIRTFLLIYPDCTEDSYLWVFEFERIDING